MREPIIESPISENPRLASAVRNANELLKEELGQSGGQIQAHWSLGEDDRHRPLIYLRISDWTGSVGYRFAPDELSNPLHLKNRFHRLWGDLLQVMSHVQMDESWWHLQGQGGG